MVPIGAGGGRGGGGQGGGGGGGGVGISGREDETQQVSTSGGVTEHVDVCSTPRDPMRHKRQLQADLRHNEAKCVVRVRVCVLTYLRFTRSLQYVHWVQTAKTLISP
jgi:hypothetical protein